MTQWLSVRDIITRTAIPGFPRRESEMKVLLEYMIPRGMLIKGGVPADKMWQREDLFRSDVLPWPLLFGLFGDEDIPATFAGRDAIMKARRQSATSGGDFKYWMTASAVAECDKLIRETRKKLMWRHVSVSFPGLWSISCNPDARFFQINDLFALKLPGLPTTRFRLGRFVLRVQKGREDQAQDERMGLLWAELPAAARKAFTMRLNNAIAAIGDRYSEDGFYDDMMERLCRPVVDKSLVSDARKFLIDRISRNVAQGLTPRNAVSLLLRDIADAEPDSPLRLASFNANEKRRGISERSLLRWFSGDR